MYTRGEQQICVTNHVSNENCNKAKEKRRAGGNQQPGGRQPATGRAAPGRTEANIQKTSSTNKKVPHTQPRLRPRAHPHVPVGHPWPDTRRYTLIHGMSEMGFIEKSLVKLMVFISDIPRYTLIHARVRLVYFGFPRVFRTSFGMCRCVFVAFQDVPGLFIVLK